MMNQSYTNTCTILRMSGGIVDCTRDLYFRWKCAQKEWRHYKVGIYTLPTYQQQTLYVLTVL
jgi:hypothetical protein